MKYGKAPIDLGPVPFQLDERMFWMYCPIKSKGLSEPHIPFNLAPCRVLVDAVRTDLGEDAWLDNYVYLTVRNNPSRSNKSLGWHSDGFLTDDLTYIWCNVTPTVFWEPPLLVDVTQIPGRQFRELRAFADGDENNYRRYSVGHLQKMDQYAVHRDDGANFVIGEMRTFVKVTVSKNKYDKRIYSSNAAFPDWKRSAVV